MPRDRTICMPPALHPAQSSPRGIGDPARYWEGCCADGGLLVVTLRDHGGGLAVWRRHPHAGRDDLDIEVRITVSRPD